MTKTLPGGGNTKDVKDYPAPFHVRVLQRKLDIAMIGLKACEMEIQSEQNPATATLRMIEGVK